MGFIQFPSTKDCRVETGANAGTNLNGEILGVGRFIDSYYTRSLIYFDLSPYVDKVITTAKLALYQSPLSDAQTCNFNVHCIDEDWDDDTVNWNNQPTYTNDAVVSLSWSDVPAAWTWKYFTITSLILDIINNSRTYYGLLLRQPLSTTFTEKQFGDNSYVAPYLQLWYKSSFRPNVNGEWKDNAQTSVNIDGTWKSGDVSTNVNGIWKPSI